MAAGSSAPELFVSLADNVFSTPRSVGIGAIIGSAIFNILIIIASTALLAGACRLSPVASSPAVTPLGPRAGQVLLLDWRPLARDTCWYLFSIILLFAFVQDQYVQWYEALILFASYGLYILYMAFNPRILAKCNQHSQRDPAGPQSARAVGTETGGPKGPASRAVYVVQAELGSRGATDEERPAPSAARTAEHVSGLLLLHLPLPICSSHPNLSLPSAAERGARRPALCGERAAAQSVPVQQRGRQATHAGALWRFTSQRGRCWRGQDSWGGGRCAGHPLRRGLHR